MSASAVVARTALAGCGIALLGVAAGAARVPAARRRGEQEPRWWERLLVRLAGLLEPLAGRSELLRREAAACAVRRRLALLGPSCWVGRVADAAGRATRISQPDHIASAMAGLRAACSVCALALAVPLAWLGGGLLGSIAVLAAIAAARAPDAVLAVHASRAERRLDAAMPAALELLAACCRGGVALESALAVTAAHSPQPLRGILDRARRRQRAGEAPASALRLEADAVGVHEVGALGTLVDRHHHLGLPLEAPLLARAQAARARARISALARAGRGVPIASLLVATVIAPCCVGVLATWVILASIAKAGMA